MDLKEWLQENGITQVSFAKGLGITHIYLNMIVNGKRLPSFKLGKRIESATFGDVTYVNLVYFYEQKNEGDSPRGAGSPSSVQCQVVT